MVDLNNLQIMDSCFQDFKGVNDVAMDTFLCVSFFLVHFLTLCSQGGSSCFTLCDHSPGFIDCQFGFPE